MNMIGEYISIGIILLLTLPTAGALGFVAGAFTSMCADSSKILMYIMCGISVVVFIGLVMMVAPQTLPWTIIVSVDSLSFVVSILLSIKYTMDKV